MVFYDPKKCNDESTVCVRRQYDYLFGETVAGKTFVGNVNVESKKKNEIQCLENNISFTYTFRQ